MKPTILAIECSSDIASLCLKRGETVFVQELLEPHSQAAMLVSVLETLLKEACTAYADITDLAFTVGPGSFTSIRIGLAVSRTILGAFPAIKAHPFTTLECLAAASPDSHIEARMRAGKGEVYRQFFTCDSVISGCAGIQSNIITPTSPIELVPQTDTDAYLPKPHARHLLAAMESITIPEGRGHSPLYIRAPDAKVSSKAHF